MKFCPSCGARYEDAAKFCQHDGTLLRKTVGGTDEDPYVGQILLGQFEIKEVIGEGGMGRVYRAHQHGFDRPVAIKILHTDLVTNQEMVKRFNREAKIISRLDHPSIIHVYLFGELPDSNLYLAMEYVDGQALTILINEGPLPVPKAVHIGRQMLSALTEAHRKGVVHRDLKPDNIMLVSRPDDPLSVKVLDFGIAKFLGSRTMLTQQGLVFGSARYISPEAAAGDPVDERADLYAVGVILYQMMAGKPPFDDASAVSLLMRHVNDKPPLLLDQPAARHVPEGIAQVVMQALEKDPAHRFDGAAAMRTALLEAVHTGGVSLPGGEGDASWAPSTIQDSDESEDRKNLFKTDPMFGGAMATGGAVAEDLSEAKYPGAETSIDGPEGHETDPQIPHSIAQTGTLSGPPPLQATGVVDSTEGDSAYYPDPNDDEIELPRSRAWIALLVIVILVVSGGALGALIALGSRDRNADEQTDAGAGPPPTPVAAGLNQPLTKSPPQPIQPDAGGGQNTSQTEVSADGGLSSTNGQTNPQIAASLTKAGKQPSKALGTSAMPPAASLRIKPDRSRVGQRVRLAAAIDPPSKLTSPRFIIKRRGGDAVTVAATVADDGSYTTDHRFKKAGTYQVAFVGTSKAGEVRAFSDTVISPPRRSKQPTKLTFPPGLRDLPDVMNPQDPSDNKPPDTQETPPPGLIEPWISPTPSSSPWK